MSKTWVKGDAVKWATPQGDTVGTVEKKLVSPMEIKGHQVQASPQSPQYLVTSSKSGKPAAHKAAALKKIGKSP